MAGASGGPTPTSPNTRTRGHKKKARTRSQLVDAAIDVIAERGETFSISDVTDRAGVANGTFYNYFADRDALVASIVPEVVSSFAARSAGELEEQDPAIRFASITALALSQAIVAPGQMRVLLRLEAAQREVLRGEPVAHLRRDLEAGRATGRFLAEPNDALLDVLVGSMLTAARRIVEGDVGADYPQEVIQILLGCLGVDSEESAAIARAVMEQDATVNQRGMDVEPARESTAVM